jgi:hypothetical protein
MLSQVLMAMKSRTKMFVTLALSEKPQILAVQLEWLMTG